MFGYDSLPSKVYVYGAKPAIENLEVVQDSIFRAHRYKNALIAVERTRREKCDKLRDELDPEISKLAATWGTLEAQSKALTAEYKRGNRLARKKRRDPVYSAAKKKTLAEQREVSVQLKTRKTALYASEPWKRLVAPIEAEADAANKKLRAECGLYWGTYLGIECTISRKGAPPEFKRWSGDGSVQIQIQKGMTFKEALDGKNPQFQIDYRGSAITVPGKNRPKKLGNAIAKFRVGSDKSRRPIFAVIPFTLHRMPPDDSRIKFIRLHRKRVGTHDHWELHLVVSKTAWDQPDTKNAKGTVGIDVGWLVMPDRSLKCATWADDRGNSGDVRLPPEWLVGAQRSRDIQSIRSKNFDLARAALRANLEFLDKPEWFVEQTKFLPQWRSEARLSKLVWHWRSNRFPGDEAAFTAAEAWRKQDRHLNDYGSCLRERLQRWRLNIFRNFAAKMRREYADIRVEKLNLTKFHRLPKPEDYAEGSVERAKVIQLRTHVRDAALSYLMGAIKHSGAICVTKVVAKNTTKACHECGSVQEWDTALREHVCHNCDELLEQDANASKNIRDGLPEGIAAA